MVSRKRWEKWLSAVAISLLGGAALAGDRLEVVAGKAVPIEEVAPVYRGRVRQVLEHPTLANQGPGEFFTGDPELYAWLLDHPEKGVLAWKRLGAKCSEISAWSDGHFSCSDGRSDIQWRTVYQSPI